MGCVDPMGSGYPTHCGDPIGPGDSTRCGNPMGTGDADLVCCGDPSARTRLALVPAARPLAGGNRRLCQRRGRVRSGRRRAEWPREEGNHHGRRRRDGPRRRIGVDGGDDRCPAGSRGAAAALPIRCPCAAIARRSENACDVGACALANKHLIPCLAHTHAHRQVTCRLRDPGLKPRVHDWRVHSMNPRSVPRYCSREAPGEPVSAMSASPIGECRRPSLPYISGRQRPRGAFTATLLLSLSAASNVSETHDRQPESSARISAKCGPPGEAERLFHPGAFVEQRTVHVVAMRPACEHANEGGARTDFDGACVELGCRVFVGAWCGPSVAPSRPRPRRRPDAPLLAGDVANVVDAHAASGGVDPWLLGGGEAWGVEVQGLVDAAELRHLQAGAPTDASGCGAPGHGAA